MTEQERMELAAELEQLYRERERLQYAAPPTLIRRLRVREQRERLESGIARLEAMRQ